MLQGLTTAKGWRWSPHQVGLVLEAAARLAYARAKLAQFRFAKCNALRIPLPSAIQIEGARRLAAVVNTASSYSPVTFSCVHRALALWWMLQARGIAAEIRIAVTHDAQPFTAHAWVQCGGLILDDLDTQAAEGRVFPDTVVPTRVR